MYVTKRPQTKPVERRRGGRNGRKESGRGREGGVGFRTGLIWFVETGKTILGQAGVSAAVAFVPSVESLVSFRCCSLWAQTFISFPFFI